MSELRGKWFDFRGTKLAVTYHPAFLLRDPRQKKETWKDLQMVMKDLGLVAPPTVAASSRLDVPPCPSQRCRTCIEILMAEFCDVARAGAAGRRRSPTAVPEGMQPVVGGRVLVPFRQQRMSGIVTALHDHKPSVKTKNSSACSTWRRCSMSN